MAALSPKLEALVEDIEQCADASDRMDYLVELAERFSEVPPSVALRPFPPEHKVPACESEVYIWIERLENGRGSPRFAVENPHGLSAKALATVLGEGLHGETLETIATLSDDLPHRIFGRELSMGKGQGLIGMVHLLKALARRAR